MSGNMRGIYKNGIKRVLDFILSLTALIILSPLLAVLYFLVLIKLGYPAVFTQERPGKNGKIFRLYKFRSMTDEKDEKGDYLPDEDRLTEFGKRLRATSLDELPELINIIKGDMSIVGPRPLLVQYLPLYNETQARRHEVRPGFTGYAQVNGRNAITWQEKFEKDVYYVDHVSFVLDLIIVLKTIAVVAGKKGVNSETSVTVEFFTGNEENLI